MQRCPYCGSVDLVADPARGDTVCGNPACGELLEEGAVVAEAQFVQTASGGRAMAGVGVNFGGGLARHNMTGQSNQELAVAKGISKLSYIAERLQLSTQIQEAGRRMYQLAVQMNFNAGRPTRFVASTCLYVVCRRNRSPHLLIDFSDVLQTPVKSLGRVYMRLMRRLVGADPRYPDPLAGAMIDVPVVDPSIFIERFSRGLDFGGMQRKVQSTAMRLIQYMHRDWICLGRRPNGLCGAALLIAAHYHGIHCPAEKVAEIVRMGEQTIRVRLLEMRETPLASLTRKEFEAGDAVPLPKDEAAEPPCMKRRRRIINQAAIEDVQRQAILDRQRLALLDKADRAAMPPPADVPKVARRRRLLGLDSTKLGGGEDSAVVAGGSSSSTSGAGSAAAPAEEQQSTALVPVPSQPSGTDSSSALPTPGEQLPLLPLDKDRAERYTQLTPTEDELEELVRDVAGQHGIQALLEGSENPGWQQAAARVESLEAGRPDFDGLPLARNTGDDGTDAASAPGSVDPEERAQDEPLSDVDDDELDSYLLDEEERRHKSDIWHEVNKDYLEEWHIRGQEARREARRKQQQQQSSTSEANESASESGSNARSRRSKLPSTNSCTQSAMMALARKGRVGSNRINIEALESLFT